MANKSKEIDLTKITNRAACLRALKKLGFLDASFTMVRGARMLSGHGMHFTIAPASFFCTDSKGDFGLIPALMPIGNTSANAEAQYAMLVDLMIQCGMISEGAVLPVLGLAVGIAQIAAYRTEGRIIPIPQETVEA